MLIGPTRAGEVKRKLLELARQLELLAQKDVVTSKDIDFVYQYADENDPLVAVACEQVFHFLADADIRMKDAEYSAWQKSKLLDLASRLRER